MQRLRSHWFLIAISATVPVAIAFPEAGNAIRATGRVMPMLTAATLFISGFNLEPGTLGRKSVPLRGIALGLLATYVAAPVFAYCLARLFDSGEQGGFFLQAAMLVAAQASTIASAPALVLVAGGEASLALVLTIVSNLLTTILTPVILAVSIGAIVSFPLGEMITRMALVILAPVIVGLTARTMLEMTRGQPQRRRRKPDPNTDSAQHETRKPDPDSYFPRLTRTLITVQQMVMLIFIYVGASAAAGHLPAEPGIFLRFLAVAVLLHLSLLMFTWQTSALAGLTPAAQTAVILCGSQKTLPNGIYLWDRFFASNPHGAIALVQYHLFQLVLDALLAARWRRASARGVCQDSSNK